jgi:hypothetical protein
LVEHADRRVARALALGQRGQGRRASRTKENVVMKMPFATGLRL